MNKAILNLLLLLSLNLIPAFAQNKTSFYSVENRLQFGDYLFCSGDYIRAIDEYKSVLNEKENDSLKFKIALAYQKINRFNDSEKYFGMLSKNSSLIIIQITTTIFKNW
jgi:tetratricopeptide (TPR) repeat protein